ncbi:MAG: YccF domain-containing protein [Gemmatimonas sp.]|uniref:YccF domain-containing protein n=1 Tax=Gemmatimonas sp. TaxID=1962908 RepID=UPI003919373B
MIVLVNLLWFICGGFLAWLGWMLAGAALAITVVGLPWAFAAFRIAPFAAWPFGRTLVDARVVGEGRIVGTGLANVLWIIFAGFWLTLAHIVAGVSLCLTIIGIPFGLAHFKLAEVSWAPLGKRIVHR